jgi:hypothetical protein
MSWNHRVLAHENNGDIYFQIHEVYYSNDGVPNSYSSNPIHIGGEEINHLRWTLMNASVCLKKPFIWAGEKFPAEVVVTYKCLCCGRDEFTSKIPHTCGKSFRKRNLEWEMKCV